MVLSHVAGTIHTPINSRRHLRALQAAEKINALCGNNRRDNVRRLANSSAVDDHAMTAIAARHERIGREDGAANCAVSITADDEGNLAVAVAGVRQLLDARPSVGHRHEAEGENDEEHLSVSEGTTGRSVGSAARGSCGGARKVVRVERNQKKKEHEKAQTGSFPGAVPKPHCDTTPFLH